MKSVKWNCKVMLQDQELFNQDFCSLRDISKELGVSYATISEKAPKGRSKKERKNSKFFTDILINRLEPVNPV